jgi:uncharacterized protein YfbU (UPF0304 family)
LSKQECSPVLDILDMYDVLQTAVSNLEDKSGIDTSQLIFLWVDDNHEGSQLAYARFRMSDPEGDGQT